MKRLLFFLAIMLLFSCKKESGSSVLTLTGTWEATFTTTSPPSHPNTGTMILTQHSDNKLTGTFDWGGGHHTLDATSQIDGNKATIDWQGNMRFSGTINTAFDYMMGDINVLDLVNSKYLAYGSWSAIRSSK
jgi:hypothetical protein